MKTLTKTLLAAVLLWTALNVSAQRIDTVTVMSDKMGREITNLVILPVQYFENDSVTLPTVYLLHGADGSYVDWQEHVDLRPLASRYGFIIVCPDGQDSWYFDSPIDPKFQFETYVGKELVNYIDSHYRTCDNPAMRAITGLSMGGHGALWIGFRHPDVFGNCGSMSGGVDISKFPDRWSIQKRLGVFSKNKQRWIDHSVISLVPTLKPGQNIIIDDGASDFFYAVNMALHKALRDHDIPHEFEIRPGKHSWKYWVKSLPNHLRYFRQAIGREMPHDTLKIE